MESWLALESNPDCFNEIIQALGIKSVIVKDVFAFEKDAFHGDRPYALFLCFSNYEEAKKILNDMAIASSGIATPSDIFVVSQKFENTSGLLALFNALANLEGRIDLGEGAFSEWLRLAKEADVADRSSLIQFEDKIKRFNNKAAMEGATNAEDKVNNRFMTFLYKEGTIYQIDARGPLPYAVGQSSEENFLVDCGTIIKDFVAKVKSESTYSVLALLPAN